MIAMTMSNSIREKHLRQPIHSFFMKTSFSSLQDSAFLSTHLYIKCETSCDPEDSEGNTTKIFRIVTPIGLPKPCSRNSAVTPSRYRFQQATLLRFHGTHTVSLQNGDCSSPYQDKEYR